MSFAPSDLSALLTSGHDAVIDVRAPSEYAEDHAPGAINLPVLGDDERARVGTIYTRQSPFLARKIGAALVARNAAAHVEGPLAGHDGGWRPLVYCWRGGMRSGFFANFLAQIGWRAEVLDGGYRSYRALVRGLLYDAPMPAPVVLLDGYTGTAKTELLHLASARGVQILDLEGLARHRGSVFGRLSEPQPSQKAFESALAERVAGLDPRRPVLVEAESSKVGARIVPPSLWAAMKAAPRLRIEAAPEARVAYLVRAYDDILSDHARLDQVLAGLIPIQGRDRIDHWRDLAARDARAALVRNLIDWHYDPRYRRQSRSAPARATLASDCLGSSDLERLADRIAGTLGDQTMWIAGGPGQTSPMT